MIKAEKFVILNRKNAKKNTTFEKVSIFENCGLKLTDILYII